MNNNILGSNIVSLLGLDALPADKKDALVEKASKILQERIALRLADEMTEEQAQVMEEMGTDDPLKIFEYMAQNVDNFDSIVKEETSKLKEEMLKVVS